MTLVEGDSQGLVTVIKQLAENSEDRLRLGRNARTLFEQGFEKTLALQKWRRVLEANHRDNTPARGVIPPTLGTHLEESYYLTLR
jgi:fatty acid-binding protein DegV